MTIQSVKRALDILQLFTVDGPRLGITQMSGLMNLPKPTVHGLVRTLAHEGFLLRDPETRKYSLGLKLYELGTHLTGTLRINRVAGAAVQRLSGRTGLMARIGVWNGDMVLVTLNLFPEIPVLPVQQLGPRVPAYCTALGKAMLSTFSDEELGAYLKKTKLIALTPGTPTKVAKLKREIIQAKVDGYATEREEYLTGLSCISAPVFEGKGKAGAAISISGPADIITRPEIGEMRGELIRTAREISLALG